MRRVRNFISDWGWVFWVASLVIAIALNIWARATAPCGAFSWAPAAEIPARCILNDH